MNNNLVLQKYLVKYLILPMSAAIIIFLLLAIIFPWQGLLVNLASTLIGSLITVLYIDYVLKTHESIKWKTAQKFINNQIDLLTNLAFSTIRVEIFNGSFMDFYLENTGKLDYSKLPQFIERILIPNLESGIREMNQSRWRTFSKNIKQVIETADYIISMFGEKIEPDVYSLILDLRENERQILSVYAIFPDVLGVPC